MICQNVHYCNLAKIGGQLNVPGAVIAYVLFARPFLRELAKCTFFFQYPFG